MGCVSVGLLYLDVASVHLQRLSTADFHHSLVSTGVVDVHEGGDVDLVQICWWWYVDSSRLQVSALLPSKFLDEELKADR